MIKHIWSLVCKEAKVDSNNNISIIDEYEEIEFALNTSDANYKKGSPIMAPFHFEVVSLFFRDKAGEAVDLQETIVVLDPGGNQLGEFESPMSFKEEHIRMRNIMKLDTIALTVSGVYLFQIFYKTSVQPNKKNLVVSIPISIKVSINGEQVDKTDPTDVVGKTGKVNAA